MILVEVAAFAALAAACSFWFAAIDAFTIATAFVVAYAIAARLFRRSSAYSLSGHIVLFAIGIALAAIASTVIWGSTVGCGHSLADPNFSSDDQVYWRWAVSNTGNGAKEPYTAFIGFPLISSWLMRLLGTNVLWPIAMNYLFTLVSLVFFALTARNLLQGKVNTPPAKVVCLSLLLCSVLTYFLSQGIKMQKEASIYLGFSITAYATTKVMLCKLTSRDWAAFAAAMLLVALVRATYIYLVAMGIMFAIKARKQRKQTLIMIAVSAAAFVIGNYFAAYSVDNHIYMIKGGAEMKELYIIGQAQQPYLDMLGNYFFYPAWKRLLALPLTMAVQFVIPFPWIYGNVDCANDLLTRIGWGWYFVGGTAMFLYVRCIVTRQQPLGVWIWWPALCFAATAYVVAGSVNRYVLPFEPLFVPAAAYVLCKAREEGTSRALKLWGIGFAAVLAITLIVCYHVQMSYLNALDEYYHSVAAVAQTL